MAFIEAEKQDVVQVTELSLAILFDARENRAVYDDTDSLRI